MSSPRLFMGIATFWIVLLIIVSFTGGSLGVSDKYNSNIANNDKTSITTANSFNPLSIGDSLLLIFQIMTWTIPASYNIPSFISIFLNLFFIATIFIFVLWIRGV